MSEKATIIGAGLVGSLLSVYLAKKGYKVTMYERRPDMRKSTISAGRSINLALSDRGWRALDTVGIGDKIREEAIPMYGRMIHDLNGETKLLPYGKENQAIFSVSRGGLNALMMDIAEENGAEIIFNQKCTGMDFDKDIIHFEDAETGEKNSIECRGTLQCAPTFGTDGAFSAARLQMQLSPGRFNYQQFYLEHGYKELIIPATKDGDFAIDKNALHIWPRGQFMLIALANPDGSFTCTLFFPFEGKHSFASLDSKEKMLNFFEQTFPDAVKLMPTLAEDYFNNPTSSLVTVKCFPWSYADKLLILGDAAHAIVPFYGQGMNAGFEDCSVLHELMEKHGNDWPTIFKEFEIARKPNADAIAELALMNFIEMRDLVAQPDFVLRKKIEARIYEKYPDKWMPLYSMVTFSERSYSDALNEGKKQDRIMEKIMEMPDIESKWDSVEVEQEILKMMG